MKKLTAIEIITALYTILFLYTAISKVIDFTIFREQIAILDLFKPLSKFIAIGVPVTEFLIVLMLTIPRWRLKGLYSAVILMIVFTLYILGILAFTSNIPCSCGGIIELMSWNQHILFNITFIILGVIAILLQKELSKKQKLEWQF